MVSDESKYGQLTTGDDATSPSAGGAVASKAPSPTNPLGTTDIPTLVGRVINILLSILGTITLVMFIYGGFLWLTSAGNDASIKKGKAILSWTTIGLLIIFISYVIVKFIFETLGV